MRRIVAAGCLSLSLVSVAGASEDDPLQLTAPSVKPANAEGATPQPPVLESTPTAPAVGPVLAVPGIPLRRRAQPEPAAMAASPLPPAIESVSPLSSETTDLPALMGPAGMPAAEDPMQMPVPRPDAERGGRSLTLESVPAAEGMDEGAHPRPPVVRRPEVREMPPGRRSPNFLGRFLSPYSGGRAPNAADDGIVVEPRNDPATDAAIKRRLEHQIRAGYGDHLRSLEVRITGRTIVIHARVNRFWQRRNVRRGIESIPALAGYRMSIEVE